MVGLKRRRKTKKVEKREFGIDATSPFQKKEEERKLGH